MSRRRFFKIPADFLTDGDFYKLLFLISETYQFFNTTDC